MSITAAFRSTINTLTRTVNKFALLQCTQNKQYHLLSQTLNYAPMNTIKPNLLAITQVPTIVPSCGFKVKGRLKRRCKDCYFVSRDERLYIICPTHRRHKQMAMKKKEKNLWVLTHATQGKTREW